MERQMSDTAFDPSAIRATDESISRIVWFDLPEGAPELESFSHGQMMVPVKGRIDYSCNSRGVTLSMGFFAKSLHLYVYFNGLEEINGLPPELRDPVMALIESFPTPILPQV